MESRRQSFVSSLEIAGTDRRFGRALLATGLVVLACVAALTSLRSAAARAWLGGEQPVASFDERLVLRGRQGGFSTRSLGTLELDPASVHLLRADLGPGPKVTFDVVGRPPSTRIRVQCEARRERSECTRSLAGGGAPGPFELQALYGGSGNVVVHGVTVSRLSYSLGRLRGLLLLIAWATPLAFVLVHRRRLLAGGSASRGLDEAALALLVFGLTMAVFHAGPVHQVMDSRFLTAVSHSFLRGRGVELPELLRPALEQRSAYQIVEIDGRLLHYYSPVPAIMDAPVVATYEALGVSPADAGALWDRATETRILRFSAAWVSALLCVVLYRLARAYLGPSASLAATLAFAFGTQVFSTLSRPYWSHAWSTLFAAAALLLVVPPRRSGGLASAALAATFASLSVFCRPQAFWIPLGLAAGLALARRGRRLAVLVTVGALWAAIGVALSLAIYDAPLPTYFFQGQTYLVEKHFEIGPSGLPRTSLARLAFSALGALVSPARGLFVYVPLCLWVLYQVVRGWSHLSSRRWAAVALGGLLGHASVLFVTRAWMGGQSYGARQFADALPWLFLLAVFGIEALERRWPSLGSAARWANLAAALLLVSGSIFVNARGAYAKATWTWRPFDRPPAWAREGREPRLPHSTMWNWRHPQFMAGLLPTERE
jgi:hypothetical protein